jgi:hypothetical protein
VSSDPRSTAARAAAVLRAAQATAAAARGRPLEDVPESAGRPSESGAPARLLAAADELEAQVAQVRAQLDELDAALHPPAPDDDPPQ